MEVTRIERSYDRTIELKTPDSRTVWLKHGARIEASLKPEEAQAVGELYLLLNEIVIAEVNTAIKNEKAKLDTAWSKPSAGNAKLSLNDLPKHI